MVCKTAEGGVWGRVYKSKLVNSISVVCNIQGNELTLLEFTTPI